MPLRPIPPRRGASAAPEAPAEARPRVESAAAATPWARVEKKAASTPALAAPPLANRAADAPPDRQAAVVPAERREPAPATGQTGGSGDSRVRLKSIYFSKVASERSVTLAIDGGRELTLRQGERAAGVEVQLILPTMAYVHQGASVFAVTPDH